MKKLMLLLLTAILSIATPETRAQDEHAYTEGPVMLVSFIRTEPGMFDEYVGLSAHSAGCGRDPNRDIQEYGGARWLAGAHRSYHQEGMGLAGQIGSGLCGSRQDA